MFLTTLSQPAAKSLCPFKMLGLDTGDTFVDITAEYNWPERVQTTKARGHVAMYMMVANGNGPSNLH